MSFRLKNKIRELDDKVNDSEFDNSNLRFDLSNAESKIRSLTNQLKLLEDKNKELENYAILFGLIQEFNNFLRKYEEEVSVGLKDRMDELNKYKVFLSEYDKKLEWDDDAKWLYFSDMNSKDHVELTKIQNEEFLRKRAENKVLNGDF